MFQKLNENKAEYILIDFIDERFKLVKLQESFFTYSKELETSKFFENLEIEYVEKVDVPEIFWKEAMDQYVDCLLNLYKQENIIIHETYCIDSYITLNNEKKYFPDDQLKYNKYVNKILKSYYNYLKIKIPNARLISILGNGYCSSESNEWGLSPVHYEDTYYQDVLQIIKNIIV